MTKQHRQDFARHMRRNQTSAESKLWGSLRKRALSGHRFHRQVSIGPYTVDFACREKMFVVEVDGATHGDQHETRYDQRRTAVLQSRGYSVYRVGNGDIYENLECVLDGILMALETLPSRFQKKPPQSLRDSSPSEAEGA